MSERADVNHRDTAGHGVKNRLPEAEVLAPGEIERPHIPARTCQDQLSDTTDAPDEPVSSTRGAPAILTTTLAGRAPVSAAYPTHEHRFCRHGSAGRAELDALCGRAPWSAMSRLDSIVGDLALRPFESITVSDAARQPQTHIASVLRAIHVARALPVARPELSSASAVAGTADVTGGGLALQCSRLPRRSVKAWCDCCVELG